MRNMLMILVALSLVACNEKDAAKLLEQQPIDDDVGGEISFVGTWYGNGVFCDQNERCGSQYIAQSCGGPDDAAYTDPSLNQSILGGDFIIGSDFTVSQPATTLSFTFDGTYIYASHGYAYKWHQVSTDTAIVTYTDSCAMQFKRVQ